MEHCAPPTPNIEWDGGVYYEYHFRKISKKCETILLCVCAAHISHNILYSFSSRLPRRREGERGMKL